MRYKIYHDGTFGSYVKSLLCIFLYMIEIITISAAITLTFIPDNGKNNRLIMVTLLFVSFFVNFCFSYLIDIISSKIHSNKKTK